MHGQTLIVFSAVHFPGNQLKGMQTDLVGAHEMQHMNAFCRFCKFAPVGGKVVLADTAFQLDGGENISVFILHGDFLRVHRSSGVNFDAGNIRKIYIFKEQMGNPALCVYKMLPQFFGVLNMSVVIIIKLGCHGSL